MKKKLNVQTRKSFVTYALLIVVVIAVEILLNTGNISSMMRTMKDAKTKYLADHKEITEEQFEELFPRWNKAVIIPVKTSSIQIDNYGSTKITRVVHDMSITSTKLVGGKDNPNVIKMSCIYSKFQK